MIDYSKCPLRYILCIDVKSFFASVEACRRGLDPLEAYIVVISDMKRPGAVVLASSPKMKQEFDIRTGNRKFEVPHDPKIQLVEPSMQLYIQINRQIHRIFQDYAADDDILTYSIDESFIDVTETAHLFGTPWQIGEIIKQRIQDEVGLPVAIGIGDNPLLAKLAMDNCAKKRPEQMAYWGYKHVPETVWQIKRLTDFWGISHGYARKFQAMGIYSIYDLAHADPDILEKRFGILGLQHYYHANGVDYSILSQRVPVKSKGFSKSQVLFRDYTLESEIRIVMTEMIESVASRLRHHEMVCQSIHLYVGFSDKESHGRIAKSKRLSRPSQATDDLVKAFLDLFNKAWKGEAVRTIHISCNDMIDDHYEQLDLWHLGERTSAQRIDRALDLIRDKFGNSVIYRGNTLMDGSTFFERNKKVGGHKAFSEVENEN